MVFYYSSIREDWSIIIQLAITIATFVRAEKAYPLGCSLHNPSYYDYENSVLPSNTCTSTSTTTTNDKKNDDDGGNGNGNGKNNSIDVPIQSIENYLMVRKIGAGKFSDVFEAVDVDAEHERQNNKIIVRTTTTRISTRLPVAAATPTATTTMIDPETLVVLKCLKPVAERKIKRELLILKHVSRLPNLAKIKAIVLPNDYYDNNSNNDDNKNREKNRSTNGKDSTNNNSNKHRIRSMPTLVLEHGHGDWFCHPIKQRGKQQQQQQTNCNDNESSIGTHIPTITSSASASYLNEYEIRYFLLHLLVALDHLHSCGIMHRDVKPRNVLINRRWTTTTTAETTTSSTRRNMIKSTSPLMLIDLGLADFYHPGTRYNVRVASRHYKSPELLLGPSFGCYDYCLDLWGVGCILAGLLFKKEPFFRGKNNLDQLGIIIAILGTTDLLHTITKTSRYKLLPDDVRGLIDDRMSRGIHIHRRPWIDFLPPSSGTTMNSSNNNDNNDHSSLPSATMSTTTTTTAIAEAGTVQQQQQHITLFQSQGMDLLDRLLVYDGEQRWTARQAMYHPFFDQVRRDVLSQVRLAAATTATTT